MSRHHHQNLFHSTNTAVPNRHNKWRTITMCQANHCCDAALARLWGAASWTKSWRGIATTHEGQCMLVRGSRSCCGSGGRRRLCTRRSGRRPVHPLWAGPPASGPAAELKEQRALSMCIVYMEGLASDDRSAHAAGTTGHWTLGRLCCQSHKLTCCTVAEWQIRLLIRPRAWYGVAAVPSN
jgi:hypothetical protein